ncbi:MAG: TRAP transporter large permease subunit, partial [Hyphomicrobiaceae bacterium]
VNLPISELFLAGIVPGCLLVIGMQIACWLVCSRMGYGNVRPFSLKATADKAPGFMLAVFAVALVLWGLYTGAFSPTEAAAVTVVYCLFAGFVLTRELKLRDIPDLVFRSGMIVGLIMPLVAVSLVMQQMFAVVGVSTLVGNLLEGLGNYYVILAVCMLVVFIAGMFLESVPITIILAPIMAPVMVKAGADPFHFAVVFVVGTAIGFVTPPFGLNLFVASSVSGVPYLRIAWYVLPYLAALLLTWFLIALVPVLSTYLVQFAGLSGGGIKMTR